MLSLVGQNKTCTFNWKFLQLNPKQHSVCLCILQHINIVSIHKTNEHVVFWKYIPTINFEYNCGVCESLNARCL